MAELSTVSAFWRNKPLSIFHNIIAITVVADLVLISQKKTMLQGKILIRPCQHRYKPLGILVIQALVFGSIQNTISLLFFFQIVLIRMAGPMEKYPAWASGQKLWSRFIKRCNKLAKRTRRKREANLFTIVLSPCSFIFNSLWFLNLSLFSLSFCGLIMFLCFPFYSFA